MAPSFSTVILVSQNFSPATLKRLAEALDTRLVYTFEPTDRDAPEYVDRFVVVP